MQTNLEVITQEAEKTKLGTKKTATEKFTKLLELHGDLIAAQREATQKTKDGEKIAQDEQRLRIYDRHYKKILEATLELASFFNLKQAGGRHANPHFNKAYDLMKEHYLKTRRILSAKVLASQMRKTLESSESLTLNTTKDPFPYRNALEVRSLFKVSLPYEDFYNK